MRYSVIALALAATMLPPATYAGFVIQDSTVMGSEDAAMGKYAPYEAPANASFRSADGSAQANQQRYKNAELLVDLAYTAVSQRGTGPVSNYDGYGDSVPFQSALGMILPNGWRIYRDKSLDVKDVPEKISYSGGRPWPEVLKQIGDRYALHFHIDWYDKTVMMNKGRLGVGMHASTVKVIHEPTSNSGQPQASSSTVGFTTASTSLAAPGTPAMVTVGGAGSATTTVAGGGAVSGGHVLPTPVVSPVPTWSVTVKDRTIREVLAKWSASNGWTFQGEHWALPVDIPLTGNATFRGDYKAAVQQLVATTELGDTPAQPCFYSNNLLRVVPFNEVCDRMSAR